MADVQKRHSYWSDPEKVENIVHIRAMEQSLNRIQIHKGHRMCSSQTSARPSASHRCTSARSSRTNPPSTMPAFSTTGCSGRTWSWTTMRQRRLWPWTSADTTTCRGPATRPASRTGSRRRALLPCTIISSSHHLPNTVPCPSSCVPPCITTNKFSCSYLIDLIVC